MTPEIWNNYENLQNNDKEVNLTSNDIEAVQNILNPENENILKELTEVCCKNLNNIFTEELAKKWYDFQKAMKTIVKNPIWVS